MQNRPGRLRVSGGEERSGRDRREKKLETRKLSHGHCFFSNFPTDVCHSPATSGLSLIHTLTLRWNTPSYNISFPSLGDPILTPDSSCSSSHMKNTNIVVGVGAPEHQDTVHACVAH